MLYNYPLTNTCNDSDKQASTPIHKQYHGKIPNTKTTSPEQAPHIGMHTLTEEEYMAHHKCKNAIITLRRQVSNNHHTLVIKIYIHMFTSCAHGIPFSEKAFMSFKTYYIFHMTRNISSYA